MICGHPECTGNHKKNPNLCPAAVERARIYERERYATDPQYREGRKAKSAAYGRTAAGLLADARYNAKKRGSQ